MTLTLLSNGSLVASGSEDGTIKIWNIDTNCLVKTLYGHTNKVRCLEVLENDNYLASGSDDTTILIWNIDFGLSIFFLIF